MTEVNKYCWVYQSKSGNYVLVSRPHRRAVNPTYLVMVKSNESWRVPYGEFRKEFKYVCRLDNAKPEVRAELERKFGNGRS